MKIAVVLGTRPEIIMATPIVEELRNKKVGHCVIHSGQHYDFEMAKVFFGIAIKEPDYFLDIVRGNEFQQFGDALQKFTDVFRKIKPDATMVFADPMTPLAACIASLKLKIPVIHIEAGNRTFDLERTEEIYRTMIDHVSQMLFCEGEEMKKYLLREGIEKKRVFVVGNTKFDMVYKYRDTVIKGILGKFGVSKNGKKVVLTTFHRQENVDDVNSLKKIIEILEELSKDNIIVFPMHPRFRKRLEKNKIEIKVSQNLNIIGPQPYLEFISLIAASDLVITDSGGVPREALVFNKPTIMYHDNFDLNKIWKAPLYISGYDKKNVLNLADKLLKKKPAIYKNPYGDGKSAKRIVSAILENKSLLKIPHLKVVHT
ncbi:MAG: UDP-N-acetylglucosamine 2-epimerase (non-hydrolyzing) [Candidatus Aenigmatarchaeota archaeon]